MLPDIAKETLKPDWTQFSPRAALRCLPAIAISLAIGLALKHPGGGMIAAGSSMSVGFGSFRRLNQSRVAPMVCATLGMCVSVFVGTLAGRSNLAMTIVAGVWGVLYGLLVTADAAAAWVGLQCVIGLLVSTLTYCREEALRCARSWFSAAELCRYSR